MTIRELNTNVTTALLGPLSLEFRIMLWLAIILLVANVAYSAYMIGFTNGQASAVDTFSITGNGNFAVLLRIGITIGLFVCAAGLAFRKSSGVIASMLGIIWVVLLYGWWQRKSLAFLRSAEVPNYSAFHPNLPHTAGLWGATWWDLLVLATAAILFIWQGIALIRILKSSDDRFGSGGFEHRL